MKKLLDPIRIPVKFKKFYRDLKNEPINILDVGCGVHGPAQAKKYFPLSRYFGIDKQECLLNPGDSFFRMDLDQDALDQIPDNFFDVVLLSHVIEHLQHPIKVLSQVCSKLKTGGRIYVEFPALRSLGLPSMEGTLQFCDDPTHLYVPNPYDVLNALLASSIKITEAKVRRDGVRFIASPLFLIFSVLKRFRSKRFAAKGLWDLFGFAYFVYGTKK